jgi:type IX secretion system PorP/SprF family membrane protein
MLKFNIKLKSMKKVILFSLILLGSIDLKAQQDEQMSLYMYNPLYFNPAYAGSRDAISTVAMGRFQWVNFKGAPMSQWFSIHSPILNKALGVGGHFIHDRIGDRVRTSAYADVSSSIQLNNKKNRLSAGLSFGFDAMSYDFTQSIVTNVNDPYFGQTLSVTKPNVGVGLYYYGDRHFIGVSVPRLLQAKDQVNNILHTLNTRHFFISGGYVFDLNTMFKLKPSALIKYTPGAPLTADVNMSLLMYDRIWTGLMYRFHESMGVNLVYHIKNTFNVGYVYDFPINGLRKYQSGSHEIILQYDIQPKRSGITSPRYF